MSIKTNHQEASKNVWHYEHLDVSLNSIKLSMFPLARNFTLIAKYKLVRVTNLSVISQSNYNKFRAIWKIYLCQIRSLFKYCQNQKTRTKHSYWLSTLYTHPEARSFPLKENLHCITDPVWPLSICLTFNVGSETENYLYSKI